METGKDLSEKEDLIHMLMHDLRTPLARARGRVEILGRTKLSPQPTAGESSTGLGLFIVKNLVEKLRGTIRVKSEPGKGTEFIIRLNSGRVDPAR